MESVIKAVSFDVWLTLLRSNPTFKKLRNEHLRTLFAPELTFENFDALLRVYDKKADVLAENSGEDYDLVRRLKLMFTGERISFAENDPRFFEASQRQEELVAEYPPVSWSSETPLLVQELAQKLPLAITSNTGMLPGTLMRKLIATAGYENCFTAYIFSDEVQASKPSPFIFETTVSRLHVPASEVVHVGDNRKADVKGAEAVGLQTRWVNTGNTRTIDQELKALLEGAR